MNKRLREEAPRGFVGIDVDGLREISGNQEDHADIGPSLFDAALRSMRISGGIEDPLTEARRRLLEPSIGDLSLSLDRMRDVLGMNHTYQDE